MATAEDDANDSRDNQDEQSADEEIRGKHEGDACVVDAAQVKDGEDQKNGDAQKDGVSLQSGHGRDQRADARGNSDGGGEDVIGEQRGGGDKAGEGAKIGARDGVRAAARWIGRDGLQVGNVNDQEQGDDGGADGHDVLHAEKAERNEQAESGFRAVSSGAETVESENGNAGGGANLFGALITGLKRLAQDDINEIHASCGPVEISEFPFVRSSAAKSNAYRGFIIASRRVAIQLRHA